MDGRACDGRHVRARPAGLNNNEEGSDFSGLLEKGFISIDLLCFARDDAQFPINALFPYSHSAIFMY